MLFGDLGIIFMHLLLPMIVLLAMPVSTLGQTGLYIKIVSHSEMKGVPRAMESTEGVTTVYVQGPRIRTESRLSKPSRQFGPTIMIQHCDTRITYAIYPEKHQYSELPMSSPEEREKINKEAKLKGSEAAPNLTIETTTVDNGETKKAFGHSAHRYFITTKQTSSPELEQEPTEIVEDSWYLDMPNVMNCEPSTHRYSGLIMGRVSVRLHGSDRDEKEIPPVRPEFRYFGPEPQGLVLSTKRTMKSIHVLQTGEKQNVELTASSEIVEISEPPIDSAIFEVPAGFTKMK